MKKLLFSLILLLSAAEVNSQVLISIIFGDKLNSPNLEFGLEGGYNWSNISNFESNKPLSTFNLGFYFDFRVKKDFYIYTGVLVKSNLGNDKLKETELNSIGADYYMDTNNTPVLGDYSQRMKYFLVPVLAKYRHKSNFYVEAGPQFGLMYKSWVEFTSDIDGKDATVKEYNKEKINKLDVGALFGAGYKFKKGPGWSVGVKYYYGFIDVYKDIANSNNRSLFIKVTLPIGAGKKKEKEQ